ncbi:hypothetical protein AB5I41_22680 [Sphingomonas sp. MMS24-JH45]
MRRMLPGVSVRGAEGGVVTFRAAARPPHVPVPTTMPEDPSVFHRGDALVLRSTAGPVAIERPVVAAQDGHAGRKAFVRDAGGQAFAVAVAR